LDKLKYKNAVLMNLFIALLNDGDYEQLIDNVDYIEKSDKFLDYDE
jgi:hypothetical protein